MKPLRHPNPRWPLALHRLLPVPGPLWGPAPQRPEDEAAPAWRWPGLAPARPSARPPSMVLRAAVALAWPWRLAWAMAGLLPGREPGLAQAQRVAADAARVAARLRRGSGASTWSTTAESASPAIAATATGSRTLARSSTSGSDWLAASDLSGPSPLSVSGSDSVSAGNLWPRPAQALSAPAARLRAALRQQGLTPHLQAKALGWVAAQADAVLGLRPYASQLSAAAALLDGRLVEMATGEGKTLATGLAAAVAALAGMPVHVVTANDYLAFRDTEALAPLYQALGLRVAHLVPAYGADDRRAVYAHDVVYATARELAFDHLRDQLAGGGGPAEAPAAAAAQLGAAPVGPHAAAPLQRGLCLALLDEADSILLDEAEMPLVLSQAVAEPGHRALWFQALALARRLEAVNHFTPWPEERRASLTEAGRACLAAASLGLGGPWRRAAWREEIAETALVGLHLLQRDRHYLVRDGALTLIDEVTGRAAPGRVWSRGLHTVVALKEGLKPDDGSQTLARTSYPRFFSRYWRLAGLSGTLAEARAELAEVYGLSVLRLPLHRPCRRTVWPTQVFSHAQDRWDAVAERCAALQAQGRPVLVGTDSVAESQALSARLAMAGLPHRVLNAVHDADEAATIARAGHAGALTVATRMAGRGTDITLDTQARAAGGLHVINCQCNPSARLDRQLAGRAARHGDPGSTETLLGPCLSPEPEAAAPPTLGAWNRGQSRLSQPPRLPARLALWQHMWRQSQHERQARARRRSLAAQERAWSRRLAFSGRAAD